MKKSFIALAFGTLGLGIAEFVIMGILPDIARALHIDIATAGHLISAYALSLIHIYTMRNLHVNPQESILFPMLFIVISCGAISGFHATQSPMMARCMTCLLYTSRCV